MTDQERFEDWIVKEDSEEAIRKDEQGVYGYWDTRQSFAAWRESRKRALEDVLVLLKAEQAHGGGWVEHWPSAEMYREGAEACVAHVERLLSCLPSPRQEVTA